MILSNLFSRCSFVYSLCFLAFTIPLYIKLNSVAIIIAAAFGLGYFIFHREEWKAKKKNYAPLLLFGGLYFGVIMGLLNSSNAPPALFDLEQKLSWLIFPFIFFLGPKVEPKDLAPILLAFTASVVAVSFYAFFLDSGFIAGRFYLGNLEWKDPRIPVSRIYLGLYTTCTLCFALCYSLFIKKISKPVLYGTLMILALALLNTFAKAAIGAFFVCLLYLLYVSLAKYRKIYLIFLALLAVAFMLFIVFSENSIKSKAVGLLNGFMIETTSRNILVVNSFNERVVVHWKCAWKTLMTGNYWLFGVGRGDSQELLDNCYLSIVGESSRSYVDMHFNSHNQYFTTWINYGLVFLLLLIYQFVFFICQFHKIGFYAGVCLSLSAMIGCLTESVFETQKGLVFYAFFQVLFISCFFEKREKIFAP